MSLRAKSFEINLRFLKRMTIWTARFIVALLLITAISAPGWAQDGRKYVEISGGYLTGDFGTPLKSDLYYISPAIGYVAPRYEVTITAPYLRLTNELAGQTNTESGIGDILLRGGYVLMPETNGGTSLDGLFAIKIPTADEAKGLGTGETDLGASISLHQRFEKYRMSLMGGYIKIGDPALVDFNDLYVYGIGITREFRTTEISASFEGRRALLPGSDGPQEIHLRFFHLLNQDYSIKGGAFAGLNDGGPDFGMNFGIVRWF